MSYGFTQVVDVPYNVAVARVTEALKTEGFGILSSIDLHEKFKEKFGVDFKKYVILGVCHPASAYQAILAEENLGLLLPCNVIVYEKENKTVLSVVKPTVIMNMIKNSEVFCIAQQIELKLERVISLCVDRSE
ncbi:MAG: DUF302 domain-containing protein [Candidatus Thermoplasmatota archaeon]|nr:DUF302 domain-containing protein [Candidatus Thermoplasmatota archaeon]